MLHADTDCPRCAELEEQVTYWREEARLKIDEARVANLVAEHRITHGEAVVLDMLLAAGGLCVTLQRLVDNLPGKRWDEREAGLNTLRVLICRLRQKVPSIAIETYPGVGYRIVQ